MLRRGDKAADDIMSTGHRVRADSGRCRDAVRVALGSWLGKRVSDLVHGHEVVFPGDATVNVLTIVGLDAKVRRLRRAALRLLPLAVVLAVEEVVGADWHLRVVLLLHRVAVLVTRVFGNIIGSFVHDLAVNVARSGHLFVRCNFINVLID